MKRVYIAVFIAVISATAALAQDFDLDIPIPNMTYDEDLISGLSDSTADGTTISEDTAAVVIETQPNLPPELPAMPNTIPPETAPSRKKIKTSFWVGLGADAVGAVIITYGVIENGNIKKHADAGKYTKSQSSENKRNNAFIIGAAVLLSGLSIHIFF